MYSCLTENLIFRIKNYKIKNKSFGIIIKLNYIQMIKSESSIVHTATTISTGLSLFSNSISIPSTKLKTKEFKKNRETKKLLIIFQNHCCEKKNRNLQIITGKNQVI